jgi:hypothetical protein
VPIAFPTAAKANQVSTHFTGNHSSPLKPDGKAQLFGMGFVGVEWITAAVTVYEYGPEAAVCFVQNALCEPDYLISGDLWQGVTERSILGRWLRDCARSVTSSARFRYKLARR